MSFNPSGSQTPTVKKSLNGAFASVAGGVTNSTAKVVMSLVKDSAILVKANLPKPITLFSNTTELVSAMHSTIEVVDTVLGQLKGNKARLDFVNQLVAQVFGQWHGLFRQRAGVIPDTMSVLELFNLMLEKMCGATDATASAKAQLKSMEGLKSGLPAVFALREAMKLLVICGASSTEIRQTIIGLFKGHEHADMFDTYVTFGDGKWIFEDSHGFDSITGEVFFEEIESNLDTVIQDFNAKDKLLSHTMKPTSTSLPIDSSVKGNCHGCGQAGHYKSDCPNVNKEESKKSSGGRFNGSCHNCHKLGHKAVDCTSTKGKSGSSSAKQTGGGKSHGGGSKSKVGSKQVFTQEEVVARYCNPSKGGCGSRGKHTVEFCKKRKADGPPAGGNSGGKDTSNHDPFGGRLFIVNPVMAEFQKNFKNMQQMEALGSMMSQFDKTA